MSEDKYVKTGEIAKLLNMSVEDVRAAARRSENPLPAYQAKPNGHLRFSTEKARNWLENQPVRIEEAYRR